MNKEILCVGNSKGLLESNLGEFIDSHEIVVRYNNFEIAGYEQHVGTKINWLCMRSCDDVRLIQPDLIEKAFTFVTYCTLTKGMRQVAKMQKSWYGDRMTIVDDGQCFEFAKLIGFNNDLKEWPSIGALSLAYFTSLGYKIKLVGFDFSASHYFKKQPKDSHFHTWEKEKNFALNHPSISLAEKK